MKFSEMPYERVECDKVKEEFLAIMEASQAAKSGEEQFEVHKKYYALMNRVMSMMTIAHIRHDGYTEDEFYKAEQEYYDQVGPELQNLVVAYSKSLYESPYRAYLEEKMPFYRSAKQGIREAMPDLIGSELKNSIETWIYGKKTPDLFNAMPGQIKDFLKTGLEKYTQYTMEKNAAAKEATQAQNQKQAEKQLQNDAPKKEQSKGGHTM